MKYPRQCTAVIQLHLHVSLRSFGESKSLVRDKYFVTYATATIKTSGKLYTWVLPKRIHLSSKLVNAFSNECLADSDYKIAENLANKWQIFMTGFLLRHFILPFCRSERIRLRKCSRNFGFPSGCFSLHEVYGASGRSADR